MKNLAKINSNHILAFIYAHLHIIKLYYPKINHFNHIQHYNQLKCRVKIQILIKKVSNYICKMAEGIKTMFRIFKKLEDNFRLISFLSVRYLAKCPKYKAQYFNEYKRATGKMKKDAKNDHNKEKKRFKEERERLQKEIQRLKQKRQHQPSENGRDRSRDRQKQRGREKYRERQRDRQREKQRGRQRERERQRERRRKQRHRSKSRDRNRSKSRQRDYQRIRQQRKRERSHSRERRKDKTIIYPEDQPVKRLRDPDFEKQFEEAFKQNKPKKKDKDRAIIFHQEDSEPEKHKINNKKIRKNQPQPLGDQNIVKPEERWSQTQIARIGSRDPNKYKILKVDQGSSDFEDQDAPQKVPQIRPREPLTPYFLFLREKRYFISQSYPELPPDNMSQTIGRVWRNLPQDEKKPYFDEYQRACRIYAKKLAQYYAVHPREVEQKQKIKNQIEERIKKQRREDQNGDQRGRKSRKSEGQGKKSRKKESKKDGKNELEDLDDYGL